MYPGCIDTDGNPRLTDLGICKPSRRHYRRVIAWLAEDYATLHAELGLLHSAGGEWVQQSKTYGHPAEDLSDLKRDIVWKLNGWHDALADHQNHTPPPDPDGHSEARCVHLARNYLLAHHEALCTFDGAPSAAYELHTLHGRIRGMHGWAHRPQQLPTPCPECQLLMMVRTVGWDRSDSIECEACGCQISEGEYGLYARVLAQNAKQQQDAGKVAACAAT